MLQFEEKTGRTTIIGFGNTIKLPYTLPHFMGYRFGLFNYATKNTGGYADFDYFHIDDKISKTN